MQIFNYKPKSDIKTLAKNYWPVLLSVVMALWFIARPAGIRFGPIRLPYPLSAILICVIAAVVIGYYIIFKLPRLKRDLLLSKPINVENGVVKYTLTKGGIAKEITFNISDIQVADVSDDDFTITETKSDELICFYEDYFDDSAKYEEFKKLLGVVNKE